MSHKKKFDWSIENALVVFGSTRIKVTHRFRRGILVEIPEKWQGKVTYKQTIRKRKSKK